MWDDEDGFFYDVLRLPDGTGQRLKVRSLVGLLPICATTVDRAGGSSRASPQLHGAHRRPTSTATTTCSATIADPLVPGVDGRHILSLVNEDKLRRILDADARRGALPRPARHPLGVPVRTSTTRTCSMSKASSTGCSTSRPSRPAGMFGGNSNWRGPVWFPINLLIIRALLQHYRYYGDDFKIECPTGSGAQMTLFEVAQELTRRLIGTFLRGRRRHVGRCTAARELFQDDPHWRDLDPVLRVLPRRQRRRARRLPPDRLDRRRGPPDPAPRPHRRRVAPQRGRGPAGPPLPTADRRGPWPTSRWPGKPAVSTPGATSCDLAGASDGPRDLRLGLARRPRRRPRPSRHPRRRARRGVGRRGPAGHRRRLADGRVGAQPDGRGHRQDEPLDAGRPRRHAARPRRRRRRGVGVLHPLVPRRRPPRRRRGPGRRPRRAGPARCAARPRLRAEPHRARPRLGDGAPRVPDRRDRGRPRARPADPHPDRGRGVRLRPRSVLPRLARGGAARRLAARRAGGRGRDHRRHRRPL